MRLLTLIRGLLLHLFMGLTIVFLAILRLFFSSWDVVVIILVVGVLYRFINIYLSFRFNLLSDLFLTERLRRILLFLRLLISILAILCTWWIKSTKYIITVITLNLFLVFAFRVKNLLVFYFFFEASLIPTLALIIIWGYQPERLQAGRYMMLYTVFASFPLLFFILWVNWNVRRLDFFLLKILGTSLGGAILIFRRLGFLVKLPIFRVHLWLPKAHVEAPLSGSMILAGVLLKLGGYGLYLLNYSFSLILLGARRIIICFVALWGGLFASLICLQQTDIKALVAYSSVAHIGLVIGGVFLNLTWGIVSAKITIVAHGFTSSALFVLVNISYKKVLSRRFSARGGLLRIFPKMALLWFLFCRINMAAPPSLNLIGELYLLPALFLFRNIFVLIIALSLFLRAGYNIILYTNRNHGASNNLMTPRTRYRTADYFSLILHLLPFFFLFKLNIFYCYSRVLLKKLMGIPLIDLQNQDFI